jgi:DNA polymerase III delta prime subunit
MHKTIDTLYLINLNKFTEKQQNQFLKAIEEPSKSAYFILIANSEAGILNTILNRSIKYHLEPYTKEQIEQITNTTVNDLAFKIFQTPGKLLNLTEQSFNDVMGLANTVVHSINKATYPNALVVSTKINYKDLYNKIDFDLFFDAVEYVALEDYVNNKTEQSLTVFKITNQFKQYATQQNLIKEILMINYLTTLWEAVQ